MLGRSFLAVLLGAAALAAPPALAQAPRLLVVGGLGASMPIVDGAEGMGSGGYVAVEALSGTDEWLAGDLYAGLVLTWPDGGCGPGVVPCDVSARIFFLGIKARVMAPIPWVGPFGEIGAGLSFGTLTTLNGPVVQAEARGVIPHWQWAVGLAIGPHHEFSLSFQYLEHERGRQTCGGIVVGYAFPL